MRLPNQIRAVACCGWVSILGLGIYFASEADSYGQAGVIREGYAGGTRLANPGAQDARSRPGNRQGTPPESLAAKAGSPGFACCSMIGGHGETLTKETAAAERSTSSNTQSMRSALPPQKSDYLREAAEGHFQRMATDAANLCGVPPALFHALIERESSWRPHVVSTAGAVGLAQVKPSTGREVSRTLDVRDPWQNLVAGACYLRKQFVRFGTWRKALHAYRLGPNAKVSRSARDYASDIIEGSAQ